MTKIRSFTPAKPVAKPTARPVTVRLERGSIHQVPTHTRPTPQPTVRIGDGRHQVPNNKP